MLHCAAGNGRRASPVATHMHKSLNSKHNDHCCSCSPTRDHSHSLCTTQHTVCLPHSAVHHTTPTTGVAQDHMHTARAASKSHLHPSHTSVTQCGASLHQLGRLCGTCLSTSASADGSHSCSAATMLTNCRHRRNRQVERDSMRATQAVLSVS